MRTRAYRSHRNHPAFPALWFTAYIVLTSATGLFATVIPEKLSPPGNLTPASGCRAHTILLVRIKRARQSHLPRPPHPRPAAVTIANAPFVGQDGKRCRV